MKLSNDDLPLRLGRRLPRDYEKAKAITEMEACAKALDVDLTVEWVNDARTPLSDFDHPSAEMDDPMAVVAAEYEKLCGRYPLVTVDPGGVGGDMTAAIRYLKDGNIHVESIDRSDLYAEVGITDIMRGGAGVGNTATEIMLKRQAAADTRLIRALRCFGCGATPGELHHELCQVRQRALNAEMNAMVDRISCIPPSYEICK